MPSHAEARAYAEPHPSIETVGIVSRGDRDAIAALVHRIGLLAEREGRTLEIVVSTQREPFALEERPRRVSLRWVDRQKRSALARAAAREGVSQHLVEWALFGDRLGTTHAGANRNALLLACAGRAFLSLDDDVDPLTVRAPRRARMASFSASDPTEFWFGPDQITEWPTTALDLLATAEQPLGRSAGELVDRQAGGDHTPIVASWLGFHGDPGTTSPLYLLAQTGATKERLLSRDTYASAKRGLPVLRGVRSLTVGNGLGIQPAAMAYDARERLPPFSPSHRGQGQILTSTVRALKAGSFAYLPLAVGHALRGEPRAMSSDAIRDAARGFPLADLLKQALVLAGRVGASYETVGAALREIAADCDVLAALVAARKRSVEHTLVAVKEGAPDAAYRRDVDQYLRELEATPVTLRPRELEHLDLPDAAEVTQRYLARFGALLEGWPVLFAIARSTA